MLKKTGLTYVLSDYIRRHVFTYTIVIIMLLMGVIFGALAAKILPENQSSLLAEDLKIFFRNFGETTQISAVSSSRQSFFSNIKTVFLGWILGLSVIGAPGIGILIFLRGFIIGFTVGFLVLQMAVRGTLFAFVSVLPQNLFIIPALIMSFQSSLAFSKAVIEDRLANNRIPLYPRFLLTCIILACAFVLLGIACVVESFITPVFIELVSKYI